MNFKIADIVAQITKKNLNMDSYSILLVGMYNYSILLVGICIKVIRFWVHGQKNKWLRTSTLLGLQDFVKTS